LRFYIRNQISKNWQIKYTRYIMKSVLNQWQKQKGIKLLDLKYYWKVMPVPSQTLGVWSSKRL
jgi:hypothetical protein